MEEDRKEKGLVLQRLMWYRFSRGGRRNFTSVMMASYFSIDGEDEGFLGSAMDTPNNCKTDELTILMV